ncbi:hypothetical protein [Paenibacillus xylaniclasticus]|uniref:hypothetical protein n=1 Tax=Paenibacillus xylaniclasticus TaxID=588083 RepID=UPI000FD706FE|nr:MULTISPECIES: hypothetical protein [Paenibacillus]GFN30318.1 hypothetical protein PCURB6_05780 [Paenibacillus curdlanolyticus]
MSEGITIRASYTAEAGAREAALKLQLLRAEAVTGDASGVVTATVSPDVLDRALHLIRQTGGDPEPVDLYR